MATSEERMKILKMIDEGKITAEDGAKLLTVLSRSPAPEKGSPGSERATAAGGQPRWLRIKVTDVRTGRSKATVNIPIALLDAGLKIGAHFAPEVAGVDMEQIRQAARGGMTGKIVDVIDDHGEHVEIFVD
ncbi:MAG: hypothetical protein KA003_13385 [Caldilineaceae bacterium]|nr:hypothetical protein [Caldilineaceae bacterium]MBP8123031.1 hypothetical protein [Caldilineaceae bacterium]